MRVIYARGVSMDQTMLVFKGKIGLGLSDPRSISSFERENRSAFHVELSVTYPNSKGTAPIVLALTNIPYGSLI